MTNEIDTKTLSSLQEERFIAPDASCFPENRLWIPEFGNVLVAISRHGESEKYHITEAGLSKKGEEQKRRAAEVLFREIGYTPIPREYSFNYTNRNRTLQSAHIIMKKFLEDETDPYVIRQFQEEPRMNTADILNKYVKASNGQSEVVIPAFLNSIDSEKGMVLAKIIAYLREVNELALSAEDDINMRVHFVDTHETTIALLLNEFFSGVNPQAEHAEIMGITTGNPEGLAAFVWRQLPPVVVNLNEYSINI